MLNFTTLAHRYSIWLCWYNYGYNPDFKKNQQKNKDVLEFVLRLKQVIYIIDYYIYQAYFRKDKKKS